MSEWARTAGADSAGGASATANVAAKVVVAPVENTHDG